MVLVSNHLHKNLIGLAFGSLSSGEGARSRQIHDLTELLLASVSDATLVQNLVVKAMLGGAVGCLMVRSPTSLFRVPRGDSTTKSTLRQVTELPYWRRSCETRFIMISIVEES